MSHLPPDPLVFDVGMNNGDDTAFYLEMGCRVVAVEANTALCEQVAARLPGPVRDGRLTILNAAVASEAGEVEFWINEDKPEWSALDRTSAERGGHRNVKVRVQAVRFADVLRQFGIPYYLKVDIENADHFCLEGIRETGLPEFVSVELSNLELLQTYEELGYTQFLLVEQSSLLPVQPWDWLTGWTEQLPRILATHRGLLSRMARKACGYPRIRSWGRRSRRFPNREFPIGSSGGFGRDLPGRWCTGAEIRDLWPRHLKHWTDHGREFWCDLHAAR